MSRSAALFKSARLGIGLLLVALLLFYVLFSKDAIATRLFSGRTITATFAEDYKLRPDVSVVKVGFVKVGKVSGVERDDQGRARVSLKVDRDVLKTLGTAPTATIRSTTLLGGSYFVDLKRGGSSGAFRADAIPASRTAVPVELDRVARSLQPGALDGLQGTLGDVDATLDARGQRALKRLLATAPDTLDPAARVLKAARGRSSSDLTHVVSGLESASDVLTRTDGQLDAILDDLTTTSTVLGTHSTQVSSTLAQLPSTLDSTDAGLDDLDRTLATVRDVSDDVRPTVQSLDSTLERLDPVLADARPLVVDARSLVGDARPLVRSLVPAAGTAQDVLQDVDGPVAKRLNGPVTTWLYEPYKGTGRYNLTSSKKTMYEEVVYALANLTRASMLSDRNGHAVSFQPGVGSGTISGLPVSPEQLFKGLTSWLWPGDPLNTLEPLTRPGGSGGSVPGGSATPKGGSAAQEDPDSDLLKDIRGLLGGAGGRP